MRVCGVAGHGVAAPFSAVCWCFGFIARCLLQRGAEAVIVRTTITPVKSRTLTTLMYVYMYITECLFQAAEMVQEPASVHHVRSKTQLIACIMYVAKHNGYQGSFFRKFAKTS